MADSSNRFALHRQKKRQNAAHHDFCYETLEDRKVLATTFGFEAGMLTIQLTAAGDTAAIETVSSDVVEVNGQSVSDSNNNSITSEDVANIAIIGNGLPNQRVTLDGYFDYGVLNNVTIEDVSAIDLLGLYELNQNFTVETSFTDSLFLQDASSDLIVGGKTDITFPGNAIVLSASANDFAGEFSAQGFSVFARDANGGMFVGTIDVQHSLVLDVVGQLSQTATDSIKVGQRAELAATGNLLLPNSQNDFNQLNLTASGSAVIGEANSVALGEVVVAGEFVLVAEGNVRKLFHNEYLFDGNFQDSMFNGPPLIPVGGTLSNGSYSFEEHEGLDLQLDNTDSYYLELDFTVGNLNIGTFKKLVDFKQGTSDNGLYVVTDRLAFYGTSNTGTTKLVEGESYTIGIQRMDGIVSVYLDGKMEFSFQDTGSLAVATGMLRLFRDDTVTSFEGTIGSVEAIRVGYQALTIVGDSNISTNGHILLNGFNNTFAEKSSFSGNDIKINSRELKLHNVDADRNLLINANGNILQAGGTISIGGKTELISTDNIRLASPSNNFVGKVNTDAKSVFLSDKNHVVLDQVRAAGNVTVIAGGAISNSSTAFITATGLSHLLADRIMLGLGDNDFVDLNLLKLEADGRAEVHHDRAVRIDSIDAGSLVLQSDFDIRDSDDARIHVTNNAKFVANRSINLGDSETDSLVMGTAIFQTPLDLFLRVNGNLQFTGNNVARFMFVQADGNITDSSTSKIDVTFRANFDGINIFLGDHPNDRFNAGSINFNGSGIVAITENSDMLLTSVSSSTLNTVLKTEGRILDTRSTNLFVGQTLTLEADKVLMGDGLASQLRFDLLRFNVATNLTLIADSAIVFSSVSSAINANLFTYHPSGIGNAQGAEVTIASILELQADEISLGREINDSIQSDRIIFNSSGAVSIAADSPILLAQTNTANSLRLESTNSIFDVGNSSLNVVNHARFVAPIVKIGDLATDTFNAGSVSFQSTGLVLLDEDSSSRLAGSSNSKFLRMTSVGNITDNATAETIITDRAVFRGVDLIIGELENDCFDVLAGIGDLITHASGVLDVQLGC